VKQGRPPAKNGTRIVRTGDKAAPTIHDKVASHDKIASQPKLHPDNIIRVSHDQKNHQ